MGEPARASFMEGVLVVGEGSGVADGKERDNEVVSADEQLQLEEEIIPTVREQTGAFVSNLDTGHILGDVLGRVNSRYC